MSRSVVKLEFKCFFNKFIIIIFLDSIETRPEQFIDRFSVYIITWVFGSICSTFKRRIKNFKSM